MSKTKITVTIDKSLIVHLDDRARRLHTSRSRLVEEAIRRWREWKNRQELIDGYREMAGENVEAAEAFLPASIEVLE